VKRGVWLRSGARLVVALAVFPALLHGAEIRGRVVNGSQENQPLPDCSVSLLRFSRATLERSVQDSVRSDRGGEFRLRNVAADSAAVFVVSAAYLGVEYFSELFHVLDPDTTIRLTVTVFDTARRTPPLHVQMHHIFAERDTADYLIREVLVLHAVGNRTFVPPVGGHTVALSIPAEAYAFQVEGGLDVHSLHQRGHALYSDQPVPPGPHQLAYRYRLPLRGGKLYFRRPVDYPTAIVSFFSPDLSAKIESSLLARAEPLPLRGRQYARLAAENLSPGTMLEVTISRTGLLTTKTSRWVLTLFLVLIAGVLALLFVLLVRYPKVKESQKREADPLVLRREQLLNEIAALDEAHDSGTIAEHEYQAKRKQLKEEVVRLTAQLRDRRKT